MGLGFPEFLAENWALDIEKVLEPDIEEINRVRSVGVVLEE